MGFMVERFRVWLEVVHATLSSAIYHSTLRVFPILCHLSSLLSPLSIDSIHWIVRLSIKSPTSYLVCAWLVITD